MTDPITCQELMVALRPDPLQALIFSSVYLKPLLCARLGDVEE